MLPQSPHDKLRMAGDASRRDCADVIKLFLESLRQDLDVVVSKHGEHLLNKFSCEPGRLQNYSGHGIQTPQMQNSNKLKKTITFVEDDRQSKTTENPRPISADVIDYPCALPHAIPGTPVASAHAPNAVPGTPVHATVATAEGDSRFAGGPKQRKLVAPICTDIEWITSPVSLASSCSASQSVLPDLLEESGSTCAPEDAIHKQNAQSAGIDSGPVKRMQHNFVSPVGTASNRGSSPGSPTSSQDFERWKVSRMGTQATSASSFDICHDSPSVITQARKLRSAGHVSAIIHQTRSCRELRTGRSSSMEAPDTALPKPSRKTVLAGTVYGRKASMIKEETMKALRDTKTSEKTLPVYSPLSANNSTDTIDLQMEEHKESFSRITLVQTLTRSHEYELVSAIFIILNSMYIALETQLRSSAAMHGSYDIVQLDWYLNIVATIFSIVFAIDLSLRVLAEQMQILKGRERFWNIFEVLVVVMSVVEVAINWVYYASSLSEESASEYLGQLSMLRVVRLIRVIRVTRAIKIIRLIHELRHMVNSITGAMKSLGWAIVLLSIVFLIFGVFFTEGVVTHCLVNDSAKSKSSAALRQHFGSLTSSTMILYAAMLGGAEWPPIMSILAQLPPEYTFAFVVFLTFTILALLNVITAVFVESAMQSSLHDREIQVQRGIEQKRMFDALLQQVFQDLDTNSSGSLSLEEMEASLNDERVAAYLRSLELDIGQVQTLFTLLDANCSGNVDPQEFVEGCLRLRGSARTLDIAVLKYQVEWILFNIESLRGDMSSRLDLILQHKSC